MNILELEKEIKGCILSAVSRSNNTSVFFRLCDVFKTHFEKPAHNITEIKKRSAKSKGDIFEVFCMMYLKTI
jgi:Tfp pilus assembly major pilin PilA